MKIREKITINICIFALAFWGILAWFSSNYLVPKVGKSYAFFLTIISGIVLYMTIVVLTVPKVKKQ